MSQSSSGGGGIGFMGMLTILFVGLKLGHVIDWSWLWVLSPMLIPFGVLALVIIVVSIAFLAKFLVSR